MYPQGYSSNNASGLDMRAERNTPRHQRSISTPESDLISEAPMYHVEPSENNANRNDVEIDIISKSKKKGNRKVFKKKILMTSM